VQNKRTPLNFSELRPSLYQLGLTVFLSNLYTMLCHVYRQVFLDHADAPVGEELRRHSSFQVLEQAAKQHCKVCERLFNWASVISYPVFRPESTSSIKAWTVFMIAYREQSHVRFLFRFFNDNLTSTWDRVKHSMTQMP
jgi:hypothetical protein